MQDGAAGAGTGSGDLPLCWCNASVVGLASSLAITCPISGSARDKCRHLMLTDEDELPVLVPAPLLP